MTLKVHGSVSILVVDDSPETRSELQSILEGAGYQQIVLAESAHEAFQRLSLANASAPAEAVELVLMDIMMRDTDGVEACRRIKADKRDRKSTRLNSSHLVISYAVFCLKKKKIKIRISSTTLCLR